MFQFVPNVAYHVPIICLAVTFHIRRWEDDGGVITRDKAARQLSHRVFFKDLFERKVVFFNLIPNLSNTDGYHPKVSVFEELKRDSKNNFSYTWVL